MIVYQTLSLLCFIFFLLFLTVFKDRVQSVLNWAELGVREEGQKKQKQKNLNNNQSSKTTFCQYYFLFFINIKSFSLNSILKGVFLTVGKIF